MKDVLLYFEKRFVYTISYAVLTPSSAQNLPEGVVMLCCMYV